MGQAPPYAVDRETTVSSVRFEIRDGSPLAQLGLSRRIATRAPSRARRYLSWLPFVSGEPPSSFDPVTLQQDVIRLRNFYRDSGHPGVEVDYRLRVDTEKNSVDIVFQIDPGEPRVLGDVVLAMPTGRHTSGLALDELNERLRSRNGTILGRSDIRALEEESLTWATARGHPFPAVQSRLEPDSASLFPTLIVELDPGTRATVDQVTIEGNRRLQRETVEAQTLVGTGETFSSDRIHESERLLLEADLLQVALIDPLRKEGIDSLVDLRVRVVEGDLRVVQGTLGYDDAEGILAGAGWEHRDLLGDARTLGIRVNAESGIWSLQDVASRRFGGTVSLKEPGFLSPRTSTLTNVHFEHEDVPREVARTVGVDFTLVHQRGPQRFFSIQYGARLKDVREFRGGGLGSVGLLESLRLLEEAAEETSFQAGVTLSASWGSRDILTALLEGWTVRGAVELAGLDPWSDSQYVRMDGSAALLRPISESGIRLLFRGRGGRILTFGRSGRDHDPLESYVRLGDVLFLEGGTDRVRGWELDLLGPKIPALSFDLTGDDPAIEAQSRYVPLGGLAHWGASAEVQVPLPIFRSRPYGLLFLDGGQVWTPDDYLLVEDGFPLLKVDNRAFFGAGGGISFSTGFGSVGLMVGYKLNPSELDLRDPRKVGEAVLAGEDDLDSVPENPWRRWQVHLRLGRVF
jgi:outer membrane protein insertion porin family